MMFVNLPLNYSKKADMRVAELQLPFAMTKLFTGNINVKGSINENKRIYYLVLWFSYAIWTTTELSR